MKKRLFLFFTCLFSCVFAFSYSFSAIGPGGQTLYYNIISAQIPGVPQQVAVTHPSTSDTNPYLGYTMPTGTLLIPASVIYNGTTYTVTEIGERAFYGCTGLSGLTLPNTLIRIKSYAFYGCTGFSGDLTLPSSITNIGEFSFFNCTGFNGNLNVLCNAVINQCAFCNVGFRGSLVFSDSITYIGNYAFANGKFSGTLNLPSALEEINDYVFYGCNRLSSVNFPNNLVYIGNHAFENCDGLTGTLNIPDAVTTIGWRAFYDCDQIQTIKIGNGVQYIYYGAFCHCGALTSLVLGDNVKRIYDFAFYGCNNLTNITLGKNLQYIDYSVFEGTSLAAITMRCSVPPTVVTYTSYRPDPYLILNVDKGAPSSGIDCTGSYHRSQQSGSYLYDYYYYYILYKDRHTYNHNLSNCPENQYSSYFTDSTTNSTSGRTTFYYNWFFGSAYTTPNGEKPYLTTFEGINKAAVYLYIPCSALEAYQSSSSWVGFNKLTYMSYFVQVQPDDSVMGSTSVTQWPTCANPQAVITANANNDYHFVRWSDGNTNTPRIVNITQDTTLTAYFASNWINVFLSTNNAAWGTTSGEGTYYYNTNVTLTASPLPHYHFEQWSDGNTNNPRALTLIQDTTLTAIFAANPHQVTVLSNDIQKGSVSGSGTYSYNDTALITATPNEDCHFVRWSDGELNNPRSIWVTKDTTITAIFASNWLNIGANSNHEEWGTVDGSGSYYFQTVATLTANPMEHYHFVCWNDNNTANPRNIFVTEDLSLVAIFEPNSYIVTTLPNDVNMGTVFGTGNYDYGSSVVLTAVANEEYHFVRWTDGNTDNPRNITVLQDTTYAAIFASNWINISLSSNNDSYGSTFGSGQYYYNSTAILMAMPYEHYHFVGWSDGNMDNPRNITTVESISLIAVFEPDMHTISILVNHAERGAVSGEGEYTYGSEVTIFAEPNVGYYFTQWGDGNTNNPRIVTVTKDTLFTALFGIYNYTVLAYSDNPSGGSVTGGGTYEFGTQIFLLAIPNNDYSFVRWNDGNTDNPRIVEVITDMTYTAIFTLNNHTITVVSETPSMGTTSGGGTYNNNDTVSIAAIPYNGYHFTQWSDGNNENPRIVIITKDTSYIAQFAPNRYNVTVTSSDSTMGVAIGGGEFTYESTITISAIASYGYHFMQWSDGNTDNPRTLTVTDNAVYLAMFVPNTFSVVGFSNNSLMGSVLGGGEYGFNSIAVLYAIPNFGYHFVRWDDNDTVSQKTIQVTENISHQAFFEANTYNLNIFVSDSTEGVATGSGSYDYGSSVMIYAIPTAHHYFVQWSDGVVDNPRMITITHDISLAALFESDPQYVLLVSSNNPLLGNVSGGGTYYWGDQVEIFANANANCSFSHWSDGETDNPRIITITDNISYIAYFEASHYFVNVVSNDESMGAVTGGGNYEYGSTVTLIATPHPGYHFERWSNGVEDSIYSFMVTNDINLIAYFAPTVGVSSHEKDEWYMFAYHGSIIIREIPINSTISIYDMSGKLLYRVDSTADKEQQYQVPATGAYMVVVGNDSAKKIIVKK